MPNKTQILIAGVGAFALIGGLYYMLSRGESEEVKEEVPSGMTYEELIEKLKQEVASMANTPKMDGTKLSEQFILNVYEVMTKYTTLFKICEDESGFQKRIDLLKEGKDAEYETLRRELDADQVQKMQELQNEVFAQFETNENEYMNGYQSHAFKPGFAAKLQETQKKVVEQVQKNDNGADLPEGLTKEKAEEIRDFAKAETQKTLRELQSTMTNQNEFQEKFMFAVSKLDDVIYIKFGFKNTDVLKAFQHFRLIPNQGGMQQQY